MPGFLATSLSKAKAEEFAERAFDESEGKMPVVLWTVRVIVTKTHKVIMIQIHTGRHTDTQTHRHKHLSSLAPG